MEGKLASALTKLDELQGRRGATALAAVTGNTKARDQFHELTAEIATAKAEVELLTVALEQIIHEKAEMAAQKEHDRQHRHGSGKRP